MKKPHHFGPVGDPDDQYREVGLWEVIHRLDEEASRFGVGLTSLEMFLVPA